MRYDNDDEFDELVRSLTPHILLRILSLIGALYPEKAHEIPFAREKPRFLHFVGMDDLNS